MSNKIELSKFSIIVPIYNVEKYLVRCLDSIFAQEIRRVETTYGLAPLYIRIFIKIILRYLKNKQKNHNKKEMACY